MLEFAATLVRAYRRDSMPKAVPTLEVHVRDGDWSVGRPLTPLVGGNGGSLKPHRRGRVCAHDDCATRLSVYNAGDWCSLHATDPRAAKSAKRAKSASARALFDGF